MLYLLPACVVLEGQGGVFVSEGEIFNVVSLQFSEIKAFSQPSEAKATLKVASHAVEIT